MAQPEQLLLALPQAIKTMASVVTSKTCFYAGKRYRKGDKLEYKGAKKDMPKHFEEVKQKAKD